ncbi:MAG: ROK family protein, partial [Sciscionella sp.]
MLTVGVDVGGTSVRGGVVDESGAVLDTARASTPAGQDALEGAIVAVVTELSRRHRVRAVGLAVAGFVNIQRTHVMFAPHLAWRDQPVAERISARLGLPVVLEHDTNAAVIAEHRYGAARGS